MTEWNVSFLSHAHVTSKGFLLRFEQDFILIRIHFDLLEPVNTAAHVSFIWWLRPLPPPSPKAYER